MHVFRVAAVPTTVRSVDYGFQACSALYAFLTTASLHPSTALKITPVNLDTCVILVGYLKAWRRVPEHSLPLPPPPPSTLRLHPFHTSHLCNGVLRLQSLLRFSLPCNHEAQTLWNVLAQHLWHLQAVAYRSTVPSGVAQTFLSVPCSPLTVLGERHVEADLCLH